MKKYNQRMSIARGNIYYLDNDGSVGNELTKRRPYILISDPRVVESSGIAMVVPITSAIRQNEFGYIDFVSNCKITGQACFLQLLNVDLIARNPEFVGKASAASVVALREALINLIKL